MGEFDKASKETKALPTPQQRPYILTSMDKKFLKFFCSSNEDLKMAQQVLHEKKSQYVALQASYKKELETIISVSQCRQQLLGDGGRKLFEEGLRFNFPLRGGATDRDMMLNVVSDQIRDGGGYVLTSKVTVAVEKYCVALANRKPEINFSDRSIQAAQQIVSALN